MGVIDDVIKSPLTTAGVGSQGIMTPQQFNNFIDDVKKQPTLLKHARVITFSGDSKDIGKIGFAGRIFVPGTEAAEFNTADEASPVMSYVTLTTKKIRAVVPITFETLEDNVEGQSLQNHVRRLIVEAFARDVAELGWNGDTASADAYLAQMDGFLKLATTNTYDFLNAAVSATKLAGVYNTLPIEYRRDKASMKYFMRPEVDANYRQSIAGQLTPLGDSMITQGNKIMFMGIGLEEAPMIAATVTPESDMLLTHPKNMMAGFSRRMLLQAETNLKTETVNFYVSARVGFQFETEEAVVKGYDILHTI